MVDNSFLTGVLQTLAKMFLLAIYAVLIRFATLEYHINPIIFSCMAFISTSFILSVVAGPGKYVKNTVLSPYTWAYSILMLIMYVSDIYILSYISATENTILSRLTVPFSILLAYFLFKRKPSKADIIGNLIMLTGISLMLFIQDISIIPIILTLSLSVAVCMNINAIIMETHPEANITQTIGNFRDRMRVIAFVSFIASITFLVFILFLSVLKQKHNLPLLFSPIVPDLKYFKHGPTILIGLAMGAIFTPIIRYFSWSGNYKIKPENVFLLLSFMPIVTFLIEKIFSINSSITINSGLLSDTRGLIIFISSFIVIFGALFSSFTRIIAETKNISIKGLLGSLKNAAKMDKTISIEEVNNTDDYDLIKYSLEFYKYDFEKVSNVLKIPATSIEVIYSGKGAYSLKPEAREKIIKNYFEKIATCDSLTGLKNRTWFMSKLKEICLNDKKYKIAFIDLDKFKPINDTYGHEVGDIVLIEIATRLKKLLTGFDVTRLGGDEFCMIIDKNIDIDTIISEISKPISIKNQNIQLNVGASVGVSKYPENGTTPDELISYADKQMYKNKKN